MKTFLKITALVALILGVTFAANAVFDVPYTIAPLIGTAAGGVGTPFLFNLDYVPQFIYWNDAANPINQLVIETTEDGVTIDANAACIAAMRGYMHRGTLAANNQILECASGKVPNKKCTIRGTTSAAGAINFFADQDNLGGIMYKVKNLNVLANNPVTVTNFTALFLPNVVTLTDRVEVFYSDGLQNTFDAAALSALSTFYQQTPAVILNNVNAIIKSATINSVLGGAAFVLSYDIKIGS
jgi:hypothetical protein